MSTEVFLTDMELDTLKEIGNLGSAKALDTLSKIVKQPVKLSVPEIRILKLKEVENLIGGPREIIAATVIRLGGQIRAGVLVLFRRNAAMYLVDLMKQSRPGTTKTVEEMDLGAFVEMSNILNNAYLTPLADFFQLKFLPFPPQVVLDVAALLDDIVGDLVSDENVYGLVIGTDFSLEKDVTIEGKFVLLLDETSLKKMLKYLDDRLGIKPERIF